ncbi:MAG: hypothetical protein HQL34_02125 [Alphaproteobacteria bacterium]|nr:hypothetical protein [Alphaproteobacteria bacterium]
MAASTAIKLVSLWRRESHMDPKPMGGDRHSHRMEAHAAEILGLIDKTPDITIAEIAAHLDDVSS